MTYPLLLLLFFFLKLKMQGGGVAVVGGILQTNENEPCSAVSNTAE